MTSHHTPPSPADAVRGGPHPGLSVTTAYGALLSTQAAILSVIFGYAYFAPSSGLMTWCLASDEQAPTRIVRSAE